MQNMPIAIFRGDDTDALGYQTIVGTIKTDLDLTGCKAVFRYLSFSAEFDPIPEDKKLTVIIPASETKKLPPGLGYASLRVYDAEGKLCTFSNRIMVFVATKTPMFGNEEFEVDFNVRPELEPLKIFVGPNPDDFDEYRGFLEKVIDRASAEKYGLAMLLDAIDSDLGADDGVAATPVAVKAAYAAIIKKLTDDYYTKEETDEAIDRVAAYYITYDAAGNPFPTYAALANATTVYSGGQVRVPTRNDYCVVLSDETHQGAEYRYIYAVAEGQTAGSWQPQFPVEGVMTVDQTVTKDSQNPVSGGGVWSAIWGALSALPTDFTSLYDWCVNKLSGKVNTSNGRANQLRLLIAATSGSSAGIYSLRVKYDGSTFNDKATLEIVKQPAGPAASEVIVASVDLSASDGTLALLQNIAPNFSTSATYALDALCVYGSVLYRCTTAVTTAGAWTGSTNWTAATVDDALAVIRAAKLDADSGTMTGTFRLKGILKVDTGDTTTYELDYYGVRVHVDGVTRQIYWPNVASLPANQYHYLAVLGNLAPSFSASATYYKDDLVQYNGTLYMCMVTSHTGEWSSSHFAVASVQGALVRKLGHEGPWVNGYIDVLERNVGESVPYGVRIYRDKIVFGAFTNTVPRGFTPIRQFDLPSAGGTLALTANVPYDLVAKTITNGAVTLDDRAINAVAVSSSLASLTVNFPTATSGKARDFGLRLTVASGITTAPQIVLPQGVTCENADGEAPEIGADGAATILYFTETASGVFLVKGEVVTAIS